MKIIAIIVVGVLLYIGGRVLFHKIFKKEPEAPKQIPERDLFDD